MLIFGSFEALAGNAGPQMDSVINFNTLCEFVDQLYYLNPYKTYQNFNVNTYEFDQWYASYIMDNPDCFKEFTNLMRQVYNGYNVWVLVDFSIETGNCIVETLIKFILEYYGYVSNVCHTAEDTENLVDGEFSMQGIQAFDQQLRNYIQYFGESGLYSDEQ